MRTLSALTLNMVTSLVYAFILAWLYKFEVNSLYGYQGFAVNDSLWSFFQIFMATTFVTLAIPTRGDTRSFLLISTHFLFFLPSIVFAFMSAADTRYIALLLAVIAVSIGISRLKITVFRTVQISRHSFLPFIFFLAATMVLIYVLVSRSFSLNFDFSIIYDVRASAMETHSSFLGYFISPISAILLPIIMIFAIERKRYGFLIAALALQVIFFGITNFKNILFSPILILSYHFFLRKPSRAFYLPVLFVALPVIAALNVFFVRHIMNSEGHLFFVNNFIRRFLFTPPSLDERHLLFFSENPFYYWSTSRLSFGLTQNPFDLALPNIIGREFFGSETWAANTGMIGSGFANGGYAGAIFYAVLLGLLLSALNAFGARIGHSIVSSISIMTILTITRSGDFTTVILTHGLLFLLVIMLVTPRLRKNTRQIPPTTETEVRQ